jgi:RNA polymerase sigma factor (sigma-70 family)
VEAVHGDEVVPLYCSAPRGEGPKLAPVEPGPARTAVFPTTQHSVLVEVRSDDAARRSRGLRALAAAYWRPVYTYLRVHWRQGHEEASDLTQEFFAALVERDLLGRFDPARARLRTYLRVCVDGLVGDAARAAARQKRGGGVTLVSFDFEGVRSELERSLPGVDSPERFFEQEWARSVFTTAVGRLRERLGASGKQQALVLLEQYDLAEDASGRPTYADLAAELGIAITDVTNRLAAARRELRRAVLEVLRKLTASEDEFRQEARTLLGLERP